MAAQSEKSFPFDAKLVNGNYDRQYLADDFAMYFRAFISSGVFLKESTNLQVIANGDMSVTLRPGKAIIEGYRYENEADLVLQLSPADGITNRIDRIAITWSKEDRDIHCTVQEGVAAYEPTAPGCRRTADYIDYVVADVFVSAGAITINQSDITDQRLNSEICGLATAFSEIDTTSLYNQIEADLEEFKTVNQEDFYKWFEALKDATAEDQTGNMLKMINEIIENIGSLEDLDTDAKTSIVDAINELKNGLDNAEVDGLSSMEQVEACTDPEKPVGAGAVQELSSSLENHLTNENDESFNFGVLNGVRGFFTNPSRADDSFIPFKQSSFNEAWVKYNYSAVSCIDSEENILHNRVNIYNKDISGNYLNVAFASTNGIYTITALQDCTVVMTIANSNYSGIPCKVISLKTGDINTEWNQATGSLFVI